MCKQRPNQIESKLIKRLKFMDNEIGAHQVPLGACCEETI